MTRVLPLPAPASTSNGPSRYRTASCCAGLSGNDIDEIDWESATDVRIGADSSSLLSSTSRALGYRERGRAKSHLSHEPLRDRRHPGLSRGALPAARAHRL